MAVGSARMFVLFYARLNMTKAQSNLDSVHRGWDCSAVRTKVRLALAHCVPLRLDLQPICRLRGTLLDLGCGSVVERAADRMAAAFMDMSGHGDWVCNPSLLPNNVRLFFEHVMVKSGQVSIPAPVGFEWYSFTSLGVLKSSLIASTAMIVGYIAFGYALVARRQDRLQRPLLFLLFSSVLLLITIRSIRFMEYWPPFAVLLQLSHFKLCGTARFCTRFP